MKEHLSAMKDSRTISRKSDHIQINLKNDVSSNITTGLEKYHFSHCALPEFDLKSVDLSTEFLSKPMQVPLLISSITGGTQEGEKINSMLAASAQKFGCAMGLGSLRAAIDHPESIQTYQVRKIAPNIILLANLGAVQLNYGFGIEDCKRAVDLIEADGLILHLNPLQEALQPEGQTNFSGLIKKIEQICAKLGRPVIAKEVGWGISETVARQLVEAGVSAIDVAGAGGTSWSQVEMYRQGEPARQRIAGDFRSWGIPTANSILMVKKSAPAIPIIASGGLKTGMDIAKCIALGASLGGIAGSFLRAAVESQEAVDQLIEEIRNELKIVMFAAGIKNIAELINSHLLYD